MALSKRAPNPSNRFVFLRNPKTTLSCSQRDAHRTDTARSFLRPNGCARVSPNLPGGGGEKRRTYPDSLSLSYDRSFVFFYLFSSPKDPTLQVSCCCSTLGAGASGAGPRVYLSSSMGNTDSSASSAGQASGGGPTSAASTQATSRRPATRPTPAAVRPTQRRGNGGVPVRTLSLRDDVGKRQRLKAGAVGCCCCCGIVGLKVCYAWHSLYWVPP